MTQTLSSDFRVKLFAVTLATGLLGFCGQHALADDGYFRAGVQAYAKRDYKKAYSYFMASAKGNPYDIENIYYQALTLQQLHNNKAAIKLYASLVSNFSYSQPGKLAANALSRLDPEYYRQLTSKGGAAKATSAGSRSTISSASSSEALSPDFASLPNDVRIPYIRENGLLAVDASVNNRPMKMLFDTGAESCSFGKNHLKDAFLSGPSGKATGVSIGVGSSAGVDTWQMPVTLKVGPIERRNFEISVQDQMNNKPLLGQTFFKDYQFTIEKSNDESGSIHFIKKSAGISRVSALPSSSRDNYAVPFTRSGRNLLVNVEVNGKQMPMFFDTGASSVAFTADQLKRANINIPDDAQTSVTSGIGGDTPTQNFAVQRIKMGPIEKSNFMVSCVGAAQMPYPLLGQSFFGEWQYTIDNANSVIRFVRR
ncbi:MAG TPA: retropepsin-like aspartic protease [Drouetiella sp.]